MAIIYTYILAPHSLHNFTVLQQAIIDFPDLVSNQQIGKAFKKDSADIVSDDGILLMNADVQQYIYVKANSAELNPAILAEIQDYSLYNIDTQPFAEYWLNV